MYKTDAPIEEENFYYHKVQYYNRNIERKKITIIFQLISYIQEKITNFESIIV